MIVEFLLWASDALRPYSPVVTMFVGAAITGFVWCVNLLNKRNREKHIKNAVTNSVLDLVDIFENIYLRADKVEEDDYEAEIASEYFSRNTLRMEMLRMNVENLMVQLDPNDDFAKKIKTILGVEAWFMDRYNDHTASHTRRVSLWKTGGGKLESQIRKVIKTVQDIKTPDPVAE